MTKQSKPKTKRAQLTQMLGRKSGVDVASISECFGWQPHSTRAALTRLRKAGLNVTSVKSGTGKPSRYHIVRVPAGGAT